MTVAPLRSAPPFRPGRSGSRPTDDDPLYAIVARAPTRTIAADWQGNDAYIYGHHLFEHGFFWEAHEAWEPVWAGAAPNSRERALLRGLIQLANAHLKAACGLEDAAARLAALAAAALNDAGDEPLMGVAPAKLATLTRSWDTSARFPKLGIIVQI